MLDGTKQSGMSAYITGSEQLALYYRLSVKIRIKPMERNINSYHYNNCNNADIFLGMISPALEIMNMKEG